MTHLNSNVPFEKMLLKFIAAQVSVLEMLSWLLRQVMEIRFTSEVGADKTERTESRGKYRAGYRPRPFDPRVPRFYI